MAAGSASNAGSFYIPTPTPTPRPRVVESPVPPAPTPSPDLNTLQTLDSLRARIVQRLTAPEVRRGRVGIKIVSLNTGKVVFETDADKYFIPASNMKNFTVAAALERLGPDFKFVTSVRAASPLDADGTIHGPLVIVGRGDVSASTSFDPAFPKVIDHYKALDALADKIAAAGVKKVDGDLIADESYFQGFAVPETWEWDDIEGYDGTEISAFPLNDNVVDITVSGGGVGAPCVVGVRPANQIVRFNNACVTTNSGTAQVSLRKDMDQNVVTISGTFPAGGKEFVRSIAFTHPAELYIALLKERLAAKGVNVSGGVQTRNAEWYSANNRPIMSRSLPALPLQLGDKGQSQGGTEITKVESPPFSVIAAKTLKPSQNNYTETILWTLGEEFGRKTGGSGTSQQLGVGVVRAFLTSIGIPADGIVQYDGSGMSRHDLITPNAVVQLYTYMAKQSKFSQVWRDSLTIGGVDGTLRNRFKGTRAEGNIRGKTGTLDQVSALSGYVTTAGGEQLVISIVTNNLPIAGSARKAFEDDIVVALANFNGKIDQ